MRAPSAITNTASGGTSTMSASFLSRARSSADAATLSTSAHASNGSGLQLEVSGFAFGERQQIAQMRVQEQRRAADPMDQLVVRACLGPLPQARARRGRRRCPAAASGARGSAWRGRSCARGSLRSSQPGVRARPRSSAPRESCGPARRRTSAPSASIRKNARASSTFSLQNGVARSIGDASSAVAQDRTIVRTP